jgi:hypothetical protein
MGGGRGRGRGRGGAEGGGRGFLCPVTCNLFTAELNVNIYHICISKYADG